MDSPQEENVWTFQGYRLSPSNFVTAMVHFYRGEITRANVWRTRLDNTTNWAVITTGAVLTFAFGSIDHSQVVILISMALGWLFLMIESRRYRYYELWSLRIRLMETEFFATMLQPPFTPHPEWAVRLVDTLSDPQFPISIWEAIGRRLRRNYIWLFLVLGLAWFLKLSHHPTLTRDLKVIWERATVGPIPGHIAVLIVAGFYFFILTVAFFTKGLRASPGEVLSHGELLGISSDFFQNLAKAAEEIPFVQRHEQLAIIVTEHPKAVSDQLLNILKRGVTALEGKGMYSGISRSVLFCAVPPSEISKLRTIVYSADESAFLVVSPTHEVWGAGFRTGRPGWKLSKEE
jgi:uncharacterized membrane protein